MSAISDSTSSRCSTKFSWILLSVSSSLTQPVELGLEDGARHFRGGGDVHVLEDQRLDLRLCRLDHRAIGTPLRPAGSGSRRDVCRFEQCLDQRGDQIAAGERVGSMLSRIR